MFYRRQKLLPLFTAPAEPRSVCTSWRSRNLLKSYTVYFPTCCLYRQWQYVNNVVSCGIRFWATDALQMINLRKIKNLSEDWYIIGIWHTRDTVTGMRTAWREFTPSNIKTGCQDTATVEILLWNKSTCAISFSWISANIQLIDKFLMLIYNSLSV